ncbi:hypothetical protein H261_08358 [Paramagnetospirillum caucaseum]|uniref:Uncharacterized protein n=1 Tax=Paramagnetospirillum caucaseum TaxID=1244869 RepID=M2Z840_9PROT|nr:hypothetical protein [Paramagnetospirillum caucaseum]EME70480.1 hypothetical protein H261_08358 [Paramagnetospirillum caucaseum]
MSEEQTPEQPQVKRRYKEWEHSGPEEVAMARKLFFGMMALLALLLGSLVYGALK